jgi:Zn-dependent metalloprotease
MPRSVPSLVVLCALLPLGASGAEGPGTERRSGGGPPAWEQFRRHYGTDWQVEWNPITGTPHRISGSYLEVRPRITQSNVEEVARSLVSGFNQLLQAHPGSLVLSGAEFQAPAATSKASGTWYVSFRQVYRGVRVEGGSVRLVIRNQKLTMMGSDFFNGILVSSRPAVPLEKAIEIAGNDMGPGAPPTPIGSELVVWPDARSGTAQYFLVWQILMPIVHAASPPAADSPADSPAEMLPVQWRYRVDATTGQILERANVMIDADLTGHVAAIARPLRPTDAPAPVDIADMTVTVTQGFNTFSAQTDGSGNYSISGLAAGAANLNASLAGPHVKVHDNDVADAAHSAVVTAPGTHDWDWSLDDASPDDVEENAFYHASRIRDRFLAGGPFNISPLPDPMLVTVRDGPYCNAYAWSAGIVFGSGNASCADNALCADVIYHEYTHRIVDRVYTTAGVVLPYPEGGAMNEAWADYFATSFTNVPEFGTGCFAGRNVSTPDHRFPDDWIGEVHFDGLIFVGALWDLRAALGKTYVDGLAIRAMKQAATSYNGYLLAVLEEDDDPAYNPSPLADNNLANGTPNIDTICHAYEDLHGIHDSHCAGHTQRPVAIIDSPSPLGLNLFTSSASSVPIIGTALGSSSPFQGFVLEYARYDAPSTWLTAGLSLTGGGLAAVSGGSLGSLSLTTLSDGLYVIRLTVTDSAGNTSSAVTSITLDRALMAGWPQLQASWVPGSPAVADLDPSFPGLEVVARDTSGAVYVLHKDGTVAAGWPRFGGYGWSPVAVGDLDGDGTLEVVTTSYDNGKVYALHEDGSPVTGWPQTCGTTISVVAGAVLADLDGDGKLDVVVGSSDTPGKVCAWNHQGLPLAGWPVSTSSRIRVSAAVGDLDRDGRPEIVVGTDDGTVYVWRNDGSSMPGWPLAAGDPIDASAALGDLNGDGALEIVVGSTGSLSGSVHVWRYDGTPLAGWPQATARLDVPASATLADLDGDGKLDVILQTPDDAIHAWRADGTALAGWPPPASTLPLGRLEFLVSSPATADIDGDGRREVVAEAGAAPVGSFIAGKVYAFHRDATLVAGWPRIVRAGPNSSPLLADVDLDGNVDVVVGTQLGGVYVWRLAGAYQNGVTDWLMYRHDNQRTGAIVHCAATKKWTATGGMASGRMGHTETLLPNGKVLIAGGLDNANSLDPVASAVLYDPATGTFAATGSMAVPRFRHTATLLPNGKVLVAGGVTAGPGGVCINSAELFDPAANNGVGAFAQAGALNQFRADYTATLLPSGKILMAGGSCTGGSSAEIYDPAANNGAGASTPTASMADIRVGHTATLLANGTVLIAAGKNTVQGIVLSSAETFDPAANGGIGAFTATGNLAAARHAHSATRLSDGRVLIAGGFDAAIHTIASAEVFDPATGAFNPTGAMTISRSSHTATGLPGGKVLVAGGVTAPTGPALALASAELYDPAAGGGTGGFTATASLATPRHSHSATLLANGKVLVAGGMSNDAAPAAVLASAEVYETTCQPFNTPVGAHVVVQPVDTATAQTPVTVTFPDVFQAGTTSLTAAAGSAPPSNFRLGGTVYYQLTTTASFSGDATVCIDYTGTSLAGATQQPAYDHHDSTTAAWAAVTVTSWDPAQDVICGTVGSPF